jgi:phosphate transport system substrate-binding protein
MRQFGRVLAFSAAVLAAGAAPGAEKIVIKGSNTFGEELAPKLIEEFRRVNPGVDIELESKGTASGFSALLAGDCDIAAASRPATEDELRLARSRGIKMNSYVIGYYGVAVIVNADNPLTNLSDAQVRDIFTGAIDNWKVLGWEDAPIRVYIRDPVSGTYLGFQELAMQRQPYTKTARMLQSYGEIAEAVRTDRHGIGYVGMHLAHHPGVHAVAINGVIPSVISVNEELYPYARQLRLYTDGNRESQAARQFIRFVQSRRGQELLSRLGFVRRFEQKLGPPASPWF